MFLTTLSPHMITLRNNRSPKRTKPTRTCHAWTQRPSLSSSPCATTWSSTLLEKKLNYFLGDTLLLSPFLRRWMAPLQTEPLWTSIFKTLNLREELCSMRGLRKSSLPIIESKSLPRFLGWLMRKIMTVICMYLRMNQWRFSLWTQIYSYQTHHSISLNQHIRKIKETLFRSKIYWL